MSLRIPVVSLGALWCNAVFTLTLTLTLTLSITVLLLNMFSFYCRAMAASEELCRFLSPFCSPKNIFLSRTCSSQPQLSLSFLQFSSRYVTKVRKFGSCSCFSNLRKQTTFRGIATTASLSTVFLRSFREQSSVRLRLFF